MNKITKWNIFYWNVLSILSKLFTIQALIVTPFIAPIALLNNNRLPKFLKWYDTPDNPTIGDESFQKNQMNWTTNRYLYAVFWLWRNPAYGFDFFLGAKIQEGFVYEFEGDDLITNGSGPDDRVREGKVFRTVTNPDGTVYWNEFEIKIIDDHYCMKRNRGWKLWPGNNPRDIANALAAGKTLESVPHIKAGDVRQLCSTNSNTTKYFK